MQAAQIFIGRILNLKFSLANSVLARLIVHINHRCIFDHREHGECCVINRKCLTGLNICEFRRFLSPTSRVCIDKLAIRDYHVRRVDFPYFLKHPPTKTRSYSSDCGEVEKDTLNTVTPLSLSLDGIHGILAEILVLRHDRVPAARRSEACHKVIWTQHPRNVMEVVVVHGPLSRVDVNHSRQVLPVGGFGEVRVEIGELLVSRGAFVVALR